MFRKAKRDLTIEEQLARGPIDLPFLTLVVLLTLVGLVMLLSASYPSAYYNLDASIDTGGNPYYYFQRQLAFAVAGLVAMFIVSNRLPAVPLDVCACPRCICHPVAAGVYAFGPQRRWRPALDPDRGALSAFRGG